MCLTLPVATLTVQELIAHKVRQEVEEFFTHRRPDVSGEYRTPEELLGIIEEKGREADAALKRLRKLIVGQRDGSAIEAPSPSAKIMELF